LTVSLSKRVQKVKPSATLAMTARAAKLKTEGKDIIALSAGEPDFDTPKHIAEAGIEAIRKGLTRYTAVDGTLELKDAIIAKFKRDNGLSYERNQILVSSGAKQTCFNLCAALFDPGDECLIPAPYWVSYPDMALLADATPVIVNGGADRGYKITAAQLQAAITPRTKLFILNSPSNPTGAAYTAAELQALGAVLDKHPQIVIAADEMYEHIYWAPEPFVSFAQANPQLYSRTVTINGVSKAYAMTGWRIGYCGGPKEIVTAMGTVQGQSTSNASSISQRAATVALNGDQSCVAEMNKAFKERHDFVVAALNAVPGIKCPPAAGTFYAFADVSGAMRTLGIKDDNAFAEYLLVEAGVAVVPGSGFGAPAHMRLSFACSLKTLEDAVGRIARAVTSAARRVG
jgi:aspartate aminotransferase